jgi:hypothetical protein
MRTKALICLVAAILGGCTVGPDYVRPKVGGTAGLWLAPVSLEAVDPQWWRALGDEQLDKLVADALAHNLDLRIAEARLQEARAISRAARGKTAPQLNATGSAAEQQVSENGLLPAKNIPGFQRRYSMFDAGHRGNSICGAVSRDRSRRPMRGRRPPRSAPRIPGCASSPKLCARMLTCAMPRRAGAC